MFGTFVKKHTQHKEKGHPVIEPFIQFLTFMNRKYKVDLINQRH